MRVLLSSYGTSGDSVPLVALADRLRQRGHRVTLAIEAGAAAAAQADGAADSVVPLGPELGPLLRQAGSTSPGAHSRTIITETRRWAGPWSTQLVEAARNVDLVVGCGLTVYSAITAAEVVGRRTAGLALFPVVPTAAYPSALLPQRVPRPAYRATHLAFQRIAWLSLRGSVNRTRRELGLGPVPFGVDTARAVTAVSPSLVPTPPDVPLPHVGHLHGAVSGELPAEVAEFLDAGPAPVYVGFGSMSVADGARVATAVRELATRHRVVFAPGWSGVEVGDVPGVLTVGSLPHGLLLSRTAAVVHHGGAGTTHAAALAGVPQVIVPFGGDQLWWAHRLQEREIAGPALPASKLDGPRLLESVAVVLGDRVRERARAVGAAMAVEDGCGATVDLLEVAASRPGPLVG